MDFDKQVINDTLEAIEGEFEEKAKNIGFVNANMAARIEAIDSEIKRLQAMKKVEVNKQEALKDYLRHNMQQCDITKIECDLFTITLRKPSDVCVIDDEEKIPQDYWKVVKSVDKALIKRALKDGHEVDGASLQAGKAGLMIK
jgi:hypothetical protein